MPEIEKIKRFGNFNAVPMFSGNSLDRKDHWRNDKAKMDEVLNAKNLKIIGFLDSKPFMDVSAALHIHYFKKQDLPPEIFLETGECIGTWIFLGVEAVNGAPMVAIDMSFIDDKVIAGLSAKNVKPIDLRSIAFQFGNSEVPEVDKGRAAILAAGKALLGWHKHHGFCAKCGAKTVATRAGFQRLCSDETCAAEHFPRTDPVVIMLTLYKDKCLLGRPPQFEGNVYSALAGFMEPGETIEEAVKREVMEEVRLEVKNVTYEVSQPWPFPSSLMIGCIADAESEHFTLDGNELESARWFTRKEISAGLAGDAGFDFSLPPKLAIANNLLQIWLGRG